MIVMTIMQLRYFLAICDYGKINVAAEQLHVSGPTLSVSIKQLEDELHLSLFIRNNNQISLTLDGNRLREKASDVVERFDHLIEEMTQPQDDLHVIRFGCHSTQLEDLCNRIIQAFTRQNQDTLMEMPSFASSELARQVESGKLELAICDQAAVQSKLLEFVPLVNCTVLGYVRQDHPLAGQQNVTAKMLESEELILLNKRTIFYKELMRWFQQGGIKPNLFLYSQREILEMTISMLERHNAVVFHLDKVFEGRVPDSVSSFSLSPALCFQTGIIRRANTPLSRGASLFWEFCCQYASS